ncbi:MAG: hypothetical protein H0V07_06885 [Propionibacteriales bacterium]|nr:hypothetical protein [Propionibacteriales bacterium]
MRRRGLTLIGCGAALAAWLLPATNAAAVRWDGPGALPWYATAPPAQPDPNCTESYDTRPPRPGDPVEWGVGPLPAGTAGSSQGTIVPENVVKANRALHVLRPAGRPFAVRLNRLFMSDGEAGLGRYKALAARYSALGLDVELQVRYHPSEADNGNIARWLDFVRRVVQVFGPNRRVTALQITNEVNLTFSPNTSDGAYRDAQKALVQGVIAAKHEARRLGHHQLSVGFNFAYRLDPAQDAAFWRTIGSSGGTAFRSAVDWVGVDLYPGTFFVPSVSDYGNSMVEALASVRRCWMPLAGLGASVPIHVEENGYPTGPGRTEATQLAALDGFVRAVQAYRGTYNVSRYSWFGLRDNDSNGSDFQSHYGLLRSDYTAKPAFGRYCQLVERFAGRPRQGPWFGGRWQRRRSLRECAAPGF